MNSRNHPSDRTLASRLSLAARLYSVFALFAVLVAAITVLSDYNTRRNAELTEAVDTASRERRSTSSASIRWFMPS
jgi:methyl-accepting chemotaxis protein